MDLTELRISDTLAEQIQTRNIPVILLGEVAYRICFQEIEALLQNRVGVIVMGYSPLHGYVALVGGRVLENPKVYFVDIPSSSRKDGADTARHRSKIGQLKTGQRNSGLRWWNKKGESIMAFSELTLEIVAQGRAVSDLQIIA